MTKITREKAQSRAMAEYALADERIQADDLHGAARARARARYWERKAESLV